MYLFYSLKIQIIKFRRLQSYLYNLNSNSLPQQQPNSQKLLQHQFSSYFTNLFLFRLNPQLNLILFKFLLFFLFFIAFISRDYFILFFIIYTLSSNYQILSYKFLIFDIIIIQYQMREKRTIKAKKYTEDEEVTPLRETKEKKIKKKQKKDKFNEDGQAENNDGPSIATPEKEINKKVKKVTDVKRESENQSQIEIENEQNPMPKIQRQMTKSVQSPLSKLQHLEKLNQNYKEIKNLHDQNLAKYNQYKSQCEELSHRVSQSRSKIQKKSQQLRDLSKSIYNESIRSNKEQYYHLKTFTDSSKLTKFVSNLAIVVEAILKCPYQNPLQFLQITRIQPDKLIANDKIVPRQNKKVKIINDFLLDFPYITANSQCIPLIRALIQSSKFVQNSKVNPLLQFPCLFIRKSGLSFSMVEQIKSILFSFIDSDNVKFSQSILKISNETCKLGQNYSQETIQELLFKGLNKMRYICLPECQFELRGLSYGGYIYINTYYVERDSSLTKQACIAYCLLTSIRELVNYVINSLTYSLNKSEEDIGKAINQIKQRKDPGFKYEMMLTNQENGFICACSQDIKILKDLSLEKLQFLGRNYTQYGNGFIFQQQRKRQQQITSEILDKYVAHKQVIPHHQINQQYESSNMSQEVNNRSSHSTISNKSMKHILDIKNCHNVSMSIIKQSSFSQEAPEFFSQIDPFTGEKINPIQ